MIPTVMIAMFAANVYFEPMGQPMKFWPDSTASRDACTSKVNEFNKKHSPVLRVCAAVFITKDPETGATYWQIP